MEWSIHTLTSHVNILESGIEYVGANNIPPDTVVQFQ